MTDAPNRAEAALQLVHEMHGFAGTKAVALFMRAMGSDALLAWEDEAGEAAPVPCDFAMEAAND